MQRTSLVLFLLAAVLAGFTLGRWSAPARAVRADSTGEPQIELRPIDGSTSLTVFYPSLNKLYVYQNPFVGLPKWSCAYSIQLGAPGASITRNACNALSNN